MKIILRVSVITLLSVLSVNSAIATSKTLDPDSHSIAPNQKAPVKVAIFNQIRDAIRTVDQINQIRLQEQRRQEAERKRQEWLQLREQRRQELEAARQAATEQQRLEAERRRQYFESLSPEEKEAYLADQRARKAKHDEVARLFVLGIATMMFGGSGTGQQDDADRVCRNQRQVGINDFETMTARQARGYGLVCN
jgi:TolA-binding protein